MTRALPAPRTPVDGTLEAPQERRAGGLDFVAFDVETANCHRGSVCAIGATVVRAGEVTSVHSWLTRPPDALNFFDGFNVALHGITQEMVAGQPTFLQRLDQLLALAPGLPLVAHNAAFDIGAIREACIVEDRPWPRLDYGCSLVMARRSLDLITYRLPVVAYECEVDLKAHHDAAADATACAKVVLEIARRRGATSLPELLSELRILMGRLDPHMWASCRGKALPSSYPPPSAALAQADPEHPLYGQVVVCTGALSIRRRDAWAAMAAFGATAERNVTKRTTMLVIGEGFTGDDPADFYTGKAAKAVAWRAKGHRIEVLTEVELVEMLNEKTSGSRDQATAATTPTSASV